jgi:hypothetical protein
VTAITMPASTNTTIATCIQIHVGDMTAVQLTARELARARPAADYCVPL